MTHAGRRLSATSRQDVANGRVRVTEWRFEPGAETGIHTHEHDYVIVPVTDGRMLIESPDGTEAHAELGAGVSYFREAGVSHNVINEGDGILIFVEVELLEASG